MVDRSDSILWQRMATEEMRREARRRGIKLSDLEEERALSVALQESATIGERQHTSVSTTTTTTMPVLTSHPLVGIMNGNSTAGSFSTPPLTDTPSLDTSEQKRSERSSSIEDDDDVLLDSDQLLKTTTATTIETATTSTVTIDITSTGVPVPLSIWQTSLPHEITNKVLQHNTIQQYNT